MLSRELRPQVLIFFLVLITSGHGLTAAVTSWWRFETDLDGTVSGLEVPNEIGGEPSIISGNGVLGFNTPDLFDTIVPGEDVPNTGSVRSYTTGGSAGIFGLADYSSTLDTTSITVEFWVRTTESFAGFVARTTNSNNAGENSTLTDGFSIIDPNSVRVNFFTSQGDGTNAFATTLDSNISINDGSWHYVAFRYNEADNRADLKVDEQVFTTFLSGPESRVLWWGNGSPEPGVMIGSQLDGNENNNTGTLDELRFTDLALQGTSLLGTPIPEPSHFILGAGALGLALVHRLKRRNKRTKA